MMPSCTVKACRVTSRKWGCTLHPLPTGAKNADRAAAWHQFLLDSGSTDLRENQRIYVCAYHFEADAFRAPSLNSIQRRLKKDAVPTRRESPKDRPQPVGKTCVNLLADVNGRRRQNATEPSLAPACSGQGNRWQEISGSGPMTVGSITVQKANVGANSASRQRCPSAVPSAPVIEEAPAHLERNSASLLLLQQEEGLSTDADDDPVEADDGGNSVNATHQRCVVSDEPDSRQGEPVDGVTAAIATASPVLDTLPRTDAVAGTPPSLALASAVPPAASPPPVRPRPLVTKTASGFRRMLVGAARAAREDSVSTIETQREEIAKLRRKMKLATKAESALRSQMRTMRLRRRAVNKRMWEKNKMITELEEEKKTILRETIERNFSKGFADILLEHLRRKEIQRNNPLSEGGKQKMAHGTFSFEARDFALELHYYSPAAYRFLRDEVISMPAERTLRRWLSLIEVKPGFIEPALERLRTEAEKTDEPLLVSLAVDDMGIHKKRRFSRLSGEVTGEVDLGQDDEEEGDEDEGVWSELISKLKQGTASKAFVLLVVGVNRRFRIPIYVAFIKGIPGEVLEVVVRRSINRLAEKGITTVNLTGDGASSNIDLFVRLGLNKEAIWNGDFSIENFTFEDPSWARMGKLGTPPRITCMLDVVHMVKLLRNMVGKFGDVFSPDLVGPLGNECIRWAHYKKLQKYQDHGIGLFMANRLTLRHIEYQRNPMKASLAVQVFSHSCAVAMNLMREKYRSSDFLDSAATAAFANLTDEVFDRLNAKERRTRSSAKDKEKPPRAWSKDLLTLENIGRTREVFANYRNVLLNLRKGDKDGKLIWQTERRTCILGLVLATLAIDYLFQRLCEGDNPLMNALSSYRFSQDFIEHLFGMIRQGGGWCRNPTPESFLSILRKILLVSPMPVTTGNCTLWEAEIEALKLIYERKRNPVKQDRILQEEANVLIELFSVESDHDYTDDFRQLSRGTTDCVEYIAGFVALKLWKSVPCKECTGILQGARDVMSFSSPSTLLHYRDDGTRRVFYPSAFVMKVCIVAEHITTWCRDTSRKNMKLEALVNLAFRQLDMVHLQSSFPENHATHRFHGLSFYQMTKVILRKFIVIRLVRIIALEDQEAEGVGGGNRLVRLAVNQGFG